MAKKRLFDLPETKGTFHVVGCADRLSSDKSQNAGTTQSGKQYNNINFGIQYEEDGASVNVGFTGYVNNEVYFWSSKDKQTKRVPWKDRKAFNQEGYIMMGKGLALSREADGKTVKPKMYSDYDAVEEIHNKLHDGDFIYASGDLNYRTYKKDGERRTAINIVPNRIYLQKFNFDWDDLKDSNKGFIFKQTFVYTDIEQEKDENDKPTGRYIVHGLVVAYNSIESVSMILESKNVANNLRKNVKPYTAMDVYGLIKMSTSVEEVVVEDDGWGDQTFAKKITAPTKREFVIIRVDKDSFDTEIYTEAEIFKAIKAVAENEVVEETYNASSPVSKDDEWTAAGDDEDDWGSDEDDLPF